MPEVGSQVPRGSRLLDEGAEGAAGTPRSEAKVRALDKLHLKSHNWSNA